MGGLTANNYQFDTSMFMDPDNFDFRPSEGSPLIDRGRIIPGLTTNYQGYAPDIGAYEYGRKSSPWDVQVYPSRHSL